METVNDKSYFGKTDYAVFGLSLVLSASVGLYFIFFGNKKKSEEEYLYGSKKMKGLPIGLSLYSSAISAISIIGIPAEVYKFGAEYLNAIIGLIIGMYLVWIIFIPIFCGNLNMKTPYEYFERRFGMDVRLISSAIYVINTLLLMPLVLYAPSLALSQVTNIHILVCTTTIGGFCILYTTFGGFKTVIWTDTLQATLMLLSCLLIAVVGISKAGGISEAWRIAQKGNRINMFNMDPNPFLRTTFWSATVGIVFFHCSHFGCSVASLQRYMSLPNTNQAKISLIVGFLGICVFHIIGGLIGIAMYAIYSGCDPIKNKIIPSSNQLVPYFVTQTLDYFPGFSGFFVAGLISAALSTLSSELNAVGGIIYYDFLLKFCKTRFVVDKGILIMKIIIIVNGLIYLISVPVLQHSKHIFELQLSISSATYGAKLGILCLGILFPRTNSKGVIAGTITSMIFIGWLTFKANTYGISSYYILPTSTENCNKTNLTTLLTTTTQSSFLDRPKLEDIFILYRLSYLYYCLLGTMITIIVGNIASYITGLNNLCDVDPLLVAPFLRSYIKNQQKPDVEMYQTK